LEEAPSTLSFSFSPSSVSNGVGANQFQKGFPTLCTYIGEDSRLTIAL
jgi:hypothetical protein